MLRTWVLTVFADTASSLAISGRDMLVGRYRSTLSSLALSWSVHGGTAVSAVGGDALCRMSRMSTSSAACAVGVRRQRLQ